MALAKNCFGSVGVNSMGGQGDYYVFNLVFSHLEFKENERANILVRKKG